MAWPSCLVSAARGPRYTPFHLKSTCPCFARCVPASRYCSIDFANHVDMEVVAPSRLGSPRQHQQSTSSGLPPFKSWSKARNAPRRRPADSEWGRQRWQFCTLPSPSDRLSLPAPGGDTPPTAVKPVVIGSCTSLCCRGWWQTQRCLTWSSTI